MRSFTLFLFALLATTAVDAASYQKIDGTIVNPIQNRAPFGGDHPYIGNNLEPAADLIGVDLNLAHLNEADLAGADLTGASFTDADLVQANFSEAVLIGAVMNTANMLRVDARNANLSGANLQIAHAAEANFSGANLTGAHLTGIDMHDADLFGAILIGATMDTAGLNGTDLRDACLTCANLTLTNFRGANLWHTDFTNAYYYSGFQPVGDVDWEATGILEMTWPEIPEVCRPAAVPEPSTLLLALSALVLVLRRWQ